MKMIIENASTVLKKVDNGFLVIKSRFNDLTLGEVYTESFVSVYIRKNNAVII
jgi:hypothetical protein